MIIQGTVITVLKYGVLIRLTPFIKALCPTLHMADGPVHDPAERFKENTKLQLRVLSTDAEDKKVLVTNKNSLINTKLPLITSYSNLKPGMMSHGFITSIKVHLNPTPDCEDLILVFCSHKGSFSRSTTE